MRYLLFALVFIFTVAVLAEDQKTPAAPPESKGDVFDLSESFAGEWVGYWFNGKRYLGKTPTVFILGKDKKWQISTSGSEPVNTGSFRVVEPHIYFKSNEVKEGELMADLLDANSFIFKEEAGRSVVYRRRSSITAVTPPELMGLWRFANERKNPKGETEIINAPFTIEFNADKFRIQATDASFQVPTGLAEGTFIIQEDLVLLRDYQGDTRAQFLFASGTLTNNNPENPYYGRKENK